MTKAAICTGCLDIVAPYRHWETDRRWRLCVCESTAVRWRDGDRGLLEVTSLQGRTGVRVLGLANSFLVEAITEPPGDAQGWRELHDMSCKALDGTGYLFAAERRSCWALIVRPGESGDVFFIDPGDEAARPAWAGPDPGGG